MDIVYTYIIILCFMGMLPSFGYWCTRLWSQAYFKTKLEYQSKFFLNFNHKQDVGEAETHG